MAKQALSRPPPLPLRRCCQRRGLTTPPPLHLGQPHRSQHHHSEHLYIANGHQRQLVGLAAVTQCSSLTRSSQQCRLAAPMARVFTLINQQARGAAAAMVPQDDTDSPNSPVATLDITLEIPLCAYSSRLLSTKGSRNKNVGALAAEVLEKFAITEDEARKFEPATRTQANNPLWHLNRKGRITASIFKDVCWSK
ncbi:hypothetical protein HPB51_001381 [Rhipicephalus microplus]|uniref:Uncharacterized protein n=1 Tax=Rhipicephalus microplus TaxID=6941 RepID=A0A9J6EEB1_RHIMP|nr:hypothetical protein HPB51_001381 [Rhipicephalus microplus]